MSSLGEEEQRKCAARFYVIEIYHQPDREPARQPVVDVDGMCGCICGWVRIGGCDVDVDVDKATFARCVDAH